jgi:hypothetical protein
MTLQTREIDVRRISDHRGFALWESDVTVEKIRTSRRRHVHAVVVMA